MTFQDSNHGHLTGDHHTETPRKSRINISPRVDIKKQPMFFGENIGLVRFDRMRYPVFEKLTVEQTSNFWQPHDVNLANDRADFDSRLLPNQKHIMVRNLGYQTLLDSVQSRLTVDAFRPWCSLPEVDDCIRAWSFFEGIHNKAYQHLVNNLYPNLQKRPFFVQCSPAAPYSVKIISDQLGSNSGKQFVTLESSVL
jgi:ribonucleotide reductase beta subunit family protein with ferritin-like domain